MSDNTQGSVSDTSAGGLTGEHPSVDPVQPLVGPATDYQFNTVQFPAIPIACFFIDDVRFAFDSSFVDADCSGGSDRPEDIRVEFAALANLVQAHPECPLSLFGHADPVGTDVYNKALSERRARAIYALLIFQSEPDTAVGYWQTISGTENWGSDQRQTMQNLTGLAAGTDDSTLFHNYMQELSKPAPNLSKTDFLAQGTGSDRKGDFQGCSEFNPLLIFSQEKLAYFDQAKQNNDALGIADRNKQNAPNRRVLGLMFRKGSRVDPSKWPCPRASEGIQGCTKRFWSDGEARRSTHLPNYVDRKFQDKRDTFACRFYQRLAGKSPCESVFEVVRIRLFDHLAQPIPGALYKLVMDGTELPAKTAGPNGDITLRSPSTPASCSIRWSRPLKQKLVFTEEDDAAEGGLSADDTAEDSAPDSEGAEEFGGYEYQRDVFIDVDGSVTPQSAGQAGQTQEGGTGEEPARRRLSNLGYSSPDTLEGQIKAFQVDCGQTPTGQVSDAEAEIVRRHDQCDPPSPGKLRTLITPADGNTST
jgi:hypothetical protein